MVKQKQKKKDPLSYRHRHYRGLVNAPGLLKLEVKVRETDLQILAPVDIRDQARHLVLQYRSHIEQYIARNGAFLTTLSPLPADLLAPPIVKAMLAASRLAGVGPMATVAGVIAEYVGRGLLGGGCDEIVVENGGDIFLKRNRDCTVGLFAGGSPLSNKIAIAIAREAMPLGICTSSATIGHSLSMGRADSVTVVAASTALADGLATRLGNEVSDAAAIPRVLDISRTIPDVSGAVIIVGDRLGVWGLELVPL